MRMHPFHRNELLLGGPAHERLSGASVCIVGLGGVGSYAAEAIARCGVAHLTVVDFDRVCLTNLNRQLHALRSTVGEPKADLVAARVRDIHPKCDVRPMVLFYSPDTSDTILDRPFDVVIDAIDHLASKLHLIETCVRRGIPVWSAMGAGGRTDPARVRVSDISETRVDPFARVVRQGLRDRGIERGVGVVWTDEPPGDLDEAAQDGFRCICPDKMNSPFACDDRHVVQGTVPWMPPIFGLALAGAAVKALVGAPLASRPDARTEQRAERMKPSSGKPSGDRKRELIAALQPVSSQGPVLSQSAVSSHSGAASLLGES
jgi:tRNA A37 threonylcarbamoyladenosine dehydratase